MVREGAVLEAVNNFGEVPSDPEGQKVNALLNGQHFQSVPGSHLNKIRVASCVFYQRGLSEAQNRYGFGMLPGHGPPDGAFSSLVLDGSPA